MEETGAFCLIFQFLGHLEENVLFMLIHSFEHVLMVPIMILAVFSAIDTCL